MNWDPLGDIQEPCTRRGLTALLELIIERVDLTWF